MSLTKAQERKLSQLERKYDKAAEPTRTFYTDRKEIEDLVKAGAIDIEHGMHLLDKAKAHYQAAEKARKEKDKPKRVLTPIGTLMRPRPSYSPVQAVSVAHGAFSRLIHVVFCLGATIGLAMILFGH